MGRWIGFLIAILIGIAAGLAYGWGLNPVQYVDTAPDTLREDFRTDFVLMVAEAYQAERDVGRAARRLALLGDEPPEVIVQAALASGARLGYSVNDLDLMRNLAKALQTWNPALEAP